MTGMNEQRLQINLPTEQNAGVFADFVRAWHTKDAFVLDFATLIQPPHNDQEANQVVLDASVVSRVRIPPAQVFELMKALEQQLSAWEKENGTHREG
jgi:formate dehydrogenase assembly factor FdhD